MARYAREAELLKTLPGFGDVVVAAGWARSARYLARTIAASRASLVRWWYQRDRAWWRRRQSSQRPALPAGAGGHAPGFRDGERDHPGVGGRGLIWQGRGGCGGAGAAAEQGGGDGADGQGGHDQHGVAGDRGVEADLGLVEPEAALAEALHPAPALVACRLGERPADCLFLLFWTGLVIVRSATASVYWLYLGRITNFNFTDSLCP